MLKYLCLKIAVLRNWGKYTAIQDSATQKGYWNDTSPVMLALFGSLTER